MADDNSYHRLLAEYRKRDNYAEVFRTALDEMAADQVDFGRVRSCIAFGTLFRIVCKFYRTVLATV